MSINAQRLNRSVKHLNKFHLFALFLYHSHNQDFEFNVLRNPGKNESSTLILFVSFERKKLTLY